MYTGDNLALLKRTMATKPNYLRILESKIEAENLTRQQVVVDELVDA
jgi:hypothetical protein